jgi:hypothetical protein
MLSLVCAGCNGTNDAAPSGGPPVSSPPAPPPAPSQSVGCNTLSFARTSDIDALPGGIWSGWLVDCSDHPQSSFVQAMVTEDGRFHIVVGDGRLLTGTLGTGGNLVDGHGIDYARDGFEYFSGPTTGLFVQGTVVERQKLQGRWGTEWGGYGYFDLDYLQEAYERPTPLADLAGAWPLYSNHTGIPVEGVWTVEADGRFDGQDGAGCLYSGQFSLIDERFSIVAVDISLSGCSRAGTYTGLAYREDLVDWYEKGIVISVDNGKQALHLSLAIERP